MINGSDLVLLSHDLYQVPETYEPDVWRTLMAEVRHGDTVADVGASIGLYTIALAKRVGAKGQVYSFEPDPESFGRLSRNVALNRVSEQVRVFSCAVGEENGFLDFGSGRGTESSVVPTPSQSASRVQSVRLDTVFADKRLDLLKIDVEGFEEKVLRGAADLLRDSQRAPRSVFVEVHPFAWDQFGVSDQSLLGFLAQAGYHVRDLLGNSVEQIADYGVIIARRSERDRGDG
jgi:FkbM family methyltransferase